MERVTELELELAQAKLAQVEAECRNQVIILLYISTIYLLSSHNIFKNIKSVIIGWLIKQFYFEANPSKQYQLTFY